MEISGFVLQAAAFGLYRFMSIHVDFLSTKSKMIVVSNIFHSLNVTECKRSLQNQEHNVKEKA